MILRTDTKIWGFSQEQKIFLKMDWWVNLVYFFDNNKIFYSLKLRKRVFFVRRKMQNPPEQPIHPLLHSITLDFNILTSRQNIKNLVDNFWGIHVISIMHAKFQASSFNGVGGDRGKEGQILPWSIKEFLTPPLHRFEGIIQSKDLLFSWRRPHVFSYDFQYQIMQSFQVFTAPSLFQTGCCCCFSFPHTVVLCK